VRKAPDIRRSDRDAARGFRGRVTPQVGCGSGRDGPGGRYLFDDEDEAEHELDTRCGTRRFLPSTHSRRAMSDSRAFCPRCGDPIVHEGPPSGAADPTGKSDADLCDDCYFEQFDLVDAPDRIEVLVCAECGAVHRGKRWVDVGATDYTDIAVEETAEALAVHVDAEDVSWDVAPEQVDQNTIRMHCHFVGVVRGTVREREVTVPVKISRQTCKRCGRIAGGSFAATVQVRAVDRTPSEAERETAKEIAQRYVADREESGDRNAFITETTDTAEGVDVKVSTSQIGRAIAERVVRQFGGEINTSRRLITEDEDGERVYRMSYAVRLPAFRPGDVVSLADDDGGPILVRSVRGNLKGQRVTTGERYEASFEDGDHPDATVLGTADEAVETTVVTVEDEHAVQVLDPETYEATTIARPSYMDPDAETVPVLRHREGLHVLPEDAERTLDPEGEDA
jgi:nonsense-mediated mRNA decay protein 3